MERKIKGVIKKWSDIKGDENPYVVLSLYDKDDGYIFFKSKEKLEEVVEKYPMGNAVEFIQTKKSENDKYWNYKTGSFKLIEKTYEPTERDIAIIRQNAMTQANNFLQLIHERLKEEPLPVIKQIFFEMAEECEKWVIRK